MNKQLYTTLKLLVLCLFLSGNFGCSKEIESTIQLECNNPYAVSTNTKKDTYQALIDKYVKLGLPGISALIEDSTGIWVASAGYADLGNKIVYTPCHIQKIASITKLMVGTLALKLQEEGRLDINDPVSKYVDADILKRLKHAEGKTIKQLMNHTTGIYDLITSSSFYLAVLNNPNKTWRQEDLLKFAYDTDGYELNNPYPAYYSNSNTCLLSMCIEKATGVTHDKLLREKIFSPLAMNNTFYQGREAIPNTSAQGYFDLHNNGQIVNVSNLITGSGNGFGGVFSNVYDLYRFNKALLVDKTLLTQQSLDLMQEFYREDEDYYTGTGLVKKYTLKPAYGIGHTGKDLGYSGNLFYFPQRNTTMIFLVNYGTNGSSSLKQTFLDFENELVDAILK